MKRYFVYLLLCRDHTLYTGWTTDPQHRLEMHNAAKGAKYTRSRLPVTLVYLEELPSKSEALRREYANKQLSRREKEKLIQAGTENRLWDMEPRG